MSELHLVVNGQHYAGWKSIRVSRSIEALAGSFALDASDRWGGLEKPWPIREEDACRVELDGEPVIDGYVDRRSISLSGSERSLSYSGRDRAASMVDSSAVMDKWSFRNTGFLDLAKRLAAPFGIEVSVQDGLELRTLDNLSKRTSSISPGEGAFSVLEQAARAAGVLVISDGLGGILVTGAGASRAATPLVQGENILDATGEFDATDRYHRYVIASQVAGADTAYGAVTRVQGSATDPAVRRTERVLLLVAEKGLGRDYAHRRADWEARRHAARGDRVSVSVLGWRQPNGDLWPLNSIVHVEAPAIGVSGDMLISGSEMGVGGGGGEVTRLDLVRPDAYTPDPGAIVRESGGAAWQDIRSEGL